LGTGNAVKLVEKAAAGMNGKDLSVIVPLYNEEDCIQPLYDAITSAIDPLDINYEMIFVDDGSKDGTFRKSKMLAENTAEGDKFRKSTVKPREWRPASIMPRGKSW
jgi:cellulose synthase/poly-beta-1,6-N-acetylglucosamine synthase-like glycosyltransferase